MFYTIQYFLINRNLNIVNDTPFTILLKDVDNLLKDNCLYDLKLLIYFIYNLKFYSNLFNNIMFSNIFTNKDILNLCLLYLDTYDNLKLRSVSKQWNNLLKTKYTCQYLTFILNNSLDIHLIYPIQYVICKKYQYHITDVSALGHTTTLDLSWCCNITDVSALGNITTLNLSGCKKDNRCINVR